MLPRPKINAEMMHYLLKKGGEYPGALGPVGQFGNTNIQAIIDGCNTPKGDLFTCVTGGYATNIIVQARNNNGSAILGQCAIYVHSTLNLVPNGITSELSIPAWTGYAWRTLAFPTKPVLSAGVDYLLECWSATVGGGWWDLLYDDVGAANQYHGLTALPPNYNAWADPCTIGGHGIRLYSIYCN